MQTADCRLEIHGFTIEDCRLGLAIGDRHVDCRLPSHDWVLPSQVRGGRRRKHYLLDTAGQRALLRAYRTFLAMVGGLQTELDALALSVSPPAQTVRTVYGRW